MSLRLLSVEDEGDTIEGSLRSLELDGHAVVRVASATEAAAVLRDEVFDVILVDQRLPDAKGGGYEAGTALVTELRQGRFGETNRETPFVFVTASSDWVRHQDLTDLSGFYGVLRKAGPLTPELRELLAKIPPGPRRR